MARPSSRWSAGLGALAVLATALPAYTQTEEAISIAHGRVLVQRNCGMCHAVGRTGPSPAPGAPAFRDLHLRYDVENLGEALAEGILTGHPSMPEFRFDPPEVIDIIRYLRSIQSRQAARIVTSDALAAR